MENNIFLTANEKKENVKKWITFFRRNIHRLITDYFGIKLYPHQNLEFYCMAKHSNYVEVASRGTAKSWKAGVFAFAGDGMIRTPYNETVLWTVSTTIP